MEKVSSPERDRQIQLMAEVFAKIDGQTPQIERYWKDGWMPVVVISPHADVLETLKHLGWKGKRPCFGVRRDVLKPLLRHAVERRWLERPVSPQLQTFAFVHLGTFLLVKAPGQLWAYEPGTLDRELLD